MFTLNANSVYTLNIVIPDAENGMHAAVRRDAGRNVVRHAQPPSTEGATRIRRRYMKSPWEGMKHVVTLHAGCRQILPRKKQQTLLFAVYHTYECFFGASAVMLHASQPRLRNKKTSIWRVSLPRKEQR